MASSTRASSTLAWSSAFYLLLIFLCPMLFMGGPVSADANVTEQPDYGKGESYKTNQSLNQSEKQRLLAIGHSGD